MCVYDYHIDVSVKTLAPFVCVCSRACDRERACVRVCVRVLMCVREYVLVHVPCHFLSYISYKIQYLYFLPLTKFTCCRYINLTDSVLRIIESTKSPVETNPLAFSFLPMRTLTAKKIEREKDTHAHSQTHMHVHTHKVKKPNTQYTLKHSNKRYVHTHALPYLIHFYWTHVIQQTIYIIAHVFVSSLS